MKNLLFYWLLVNQKMIVKFLYLQLKKNLLVKLEKKSDVLKISYLDKEKDLIIPVLKQISRKYQDYSGKDRLKSLSKAKKYLDIFKDHPYIFNLGHGVLPETDPNIMDFLVKFVKDY